MNEGPGRGRRGSDARSGPTGRTKVSREHPGARTPGVLVDLEVLGVPGRPAAGAQGKPRAAGVQVPTRARGECWSTRSTGREGGTQGRAPGATAHRPPPRPRIPLWERGPPGRTPGGAHARQAAAPTDYPLLPRPSPGPKAPARRERGRCGGHPNARRRAGGAPPSSPFPSTRPYRTHTLGRRDGHQPPPAGRRRRARPANRPPPPHTPRAGGGRVGDAAERAAGTGKRARGEEGEQTPDSRRGRGGGTSDKPLCRGLTFNRSQRGSCSATYETPTQKQVVYEWFSTRFPTNVRCVTGEGAAPFPAAPHFPGRGALRTGPRSRRAAGHATPRGARAAARRRGRRGTGYPRPTEAPRRCRIVPPGRDSDLEAFSHNPTDGSFAPLAPQPSTYTKCLNLRFLSY